MDWVGEREAMAHRYKMNGLCPGPGVNLFTLSLLSRAVIDMGTAGEEEEQVLSNAFWPLFSTTTCCRVIQGCKFMCVVREAGLSVTLT